MAPATHQALIAQARALQADIDRLLHELGEPEPLVPELTGQ